MILRVSFVTMFTISYIALSHAKASEDLPQDSGLTLFLTAEDQQALEQRQSIAPQLNQTGGSDQIGILHANEDNTVVDHVINSVSYDGIVMKGNQVLGVWLDGKGVSELEAYTGTDQVAIGADGQLWLTKEGRSVTLFPGDNYSPYGEAASRVVSDDQDDIDADAISDEPGQGESDIPTSDVGDSDAKESDQTDKSPS